MNELSAHRNDAASALVRHAEALYRARRIPEAEAAFADALACGGDPAPTIEPRWTCAMLQGHFETAWAISDGVLRARRPVRRNDPALPLHSRHVWSGAPLAGRKVLVRCYHGLGDTIQFVRYAPLLKQRGCIVFVQAQRALLPLLAQVRGIDRLVALEDGEPRLAYDLDIESMELPHAFRTRLATIPASVPYLSVPALLVDEAKRLLPAAHRRIGIVWASGDWRPHRSLPLPALAPLFDDARAAWVALQRGAAGQQARAARFPGLHFLPLSGDIVESAALIRALDLVITVDTMVAHLAGVLGAPVWTLLHYDADWRWLLDRADSPWYPTMRLFRQQTPDDWQPVVAEVAAALSGLLQ